MPNNLNNQEKLDQLIDEFRKKQAKEILEKYAGTKKVENLSPKEKEEKDYQALTNEQDYRHSEEKHKARLEYADKIYKLICEWLVFVGTVVLVSMFHISCKGLKIEIGSTVVITLITTTTGMVLGLFGFVMGWLFPRIKDKSL